MHLGNSPEGVPKCGSNMYLAAGVLQGFQAGAHAADFFEAAKASFRRLRGDDGLNERSIYALDWNAD